jgi:predicted Zn-dependent peptidase
MCVGSSCVKKYGYIDKAKEITPESAARAYAEILKTARIELMFVGCGRPDGARELFRGQMASLQRSPVTLQVTERKAKADKVRSETEEMEIAQGKLVMGFRTGGALTQREATAMKVMSALYGGTPFSRLFLNVREKMSLCYYCAARYDRSYQAMLVDSGVECENAEARAEEILHQLEMLRQGDFTERSFRTPSVLATGLRSVTDSLGATRVGYMTGFEGKEVFRMRSGPVEAVTKEEIIAAARRVTLDTVYFLKGKEA